MKCRWCGILDTIKVKQDTHVHLDKKRLNYNFLQFWQSWECWSSCYSYCSPQPLPKLLASVRYKFVILFVAYKREGWPTNTRNRELQWKDDLHVIWYRLHSVVGAMLHCCFLVLQMVSSQANQKVIHWCCDYLRWNIINSLVIARETGQ